MAHRTFRDRNGVEWQVWDVITDTFVGATLDGGWLTFLAGEDKRRLAPVPLYWVSAPDSDLIGLLETAKPVAVRGTSAPGPSAEAPAEERT